MTANELEQVESLESALLPIDEGLLGEMLEFGKLHYPEGDPYRSCSFRHWLFLENPHGAALATVIRHGKRIVGHAALIPVRFRLPGGGKRLGHFVVDVLTHPDYRNQRLFSRLIELMKVASERDQTWLLGHPNAAALRGWQRHDMQFHDELAPCVLIPSPFSGGRWEREPARILAAWGEHGRELGLIDRLEIDRTAEYIEWRFLRRPDKQYRTGLLLDRDARAIAWQATTEWRYGLNLLVDHASSGRVALAAGFGTLALLSPKEPLVRNGLRLPVRKRIPFFLTDPTGASMDCSRVTLAASDF